MKNKIIKFVYIAVNLLFVLPSVIYLIKYKTVVGVNTENHFFLNENFSRLIATIVYLVIFILLMILYRLLLKKKVFQNIKQILIFVTIIGGIYVFMMPWTSSDIFYYMGVGELDGVYHQNPYYVTMSSYAQENQANIKDEILECGINNCWASTTVVYGTIAQMIFTICSSLSFKNATLAIFIFKLVNLVVHILNCFMIYKLSKKKVFSIMYGINPFILLELIGNAHNDVIILLFVLLSLYFVIKKKNLVLSVMFLALASGMKYYTILLLPIILFYHFRNEENLIHKIVKSIKYAVLFLVFYLIEYIPYFEDISIFFASFVQVGRYTKSIYAGLMELGVIGSALSVLLRYGVIIAFLITCIKSYIEFVFNQNNKISTMLKKYNTILMLAILVLSNCQAWYFSWLFSTIMWQKSIWQHRIIAFSAITEIANFVYMIYASYPGLSFNYIVSIIILMSMWEIYSRLKKGDIKKLKA